MAKLLQGELFEDAWTPIKREVAPTETYEDFVAKFKKDAPKTTDDCYTPQPVYEAVLAWLGERVDLSGRSIIRPFYPGGDYANEAYPANCVVVDNPPFSILTKIVKFYVAHKIDFFLFAPALTLFSVFRGSDICYIVTNSNIVYENGAVVNTGFVSSLFPGLRIRVSKTLHDAVALAQPPSEPKLPKYVLPGNVVTAARLHPLVPAGDWDVPASEAFPVNRIASMPQGLYGGGFLLSDTQAAQAAKAARAARAAQAAQAARAAQAAQAHTYPLTAPELNIIEQLNKKAKSNETNN